MLTNSRMRSTLCGIIEFNEHPFRWRDKIFPISHQLLCESYDACEDDCKAPFEFPFHHDFITKNFYVQDPLSFHNQIWLFFENNDAITECHNSGQIDMKNVIWLPNSTRIKGIARAATEVFVWGVKLKPVKKW
jgi:hypothetical protein